MDQIVRTLLIFVNFIYISALETARKITNIVRSFVHLEFELFKLGKYSWCYEFLKVGIFFLLNR